MVLKSCNSVIESDIGILKSSTWILEPERDYSGDDEHRRQSTLHSVFEKQNQVG